MTGRVRLALCRGAGGFWWVSVSTVSQGVIVRVQRASPIYGDRGEGYVRDKQPVMKGV